MNKEKLLLVDFFDFFFLLSITSVIGYCLVRTFFSFFVSPTVFSFVFSLIVFSAEVFLVIHSAVFLLSVFMDQKPNATENAQKATMLSARHGLRESFGQAMLVQKPGNEWGSPGKNLETYFAEQKEASFESIQVFKNLGKDFFKNPRALLSASFYFIGWALGIFRLVQ